MIQKNGSVENWLRCVLRKTEKKGKENENKTAYCDDPGPCHVDRRL